MEDRFNISGRVALVTGAGSHGIGNQSAQILAQHGAKVFIVDINEEKLPTTVEKIKAEGGEAAYMVADVRDEEACKASVKACIEAFGRLDIMVLSAGISGASIFEGFDTAFDTENWRNVLATNLDGIFFMIKYGEPECAKGGVGAIVPIASLAAWKAEGSVAYTATKGAIRSLTPMLAKMFASDRVRVNTFYPGFIDTDMTHQAVEYKPFADAQIARTPLSRFGDVDDCAYGVLYLASDASSYMTGQHLVVDGGVLC